MRKLMDDLENAAFKLQDMGKKALKNASEQFEKTKPSLREGLDSAWNACETGAERAVESAKNAYERAKPSFGEGIDRAFESAKSACERAVDSLRSARDNLSPDSGDAASQKKTGPEEALDLDVEEALAKIRAAKTESNIISDYISRKYGKNDD